MGNIVTDETLIICINFCVKLYLVLASIGLSPSIYLQIYNHSTLRTCS